MVDTFEIDNGELGNLTNVHTFVLGVEWEQFKQKLLSGEAYFECMVHAENTGRLQNLTARYGRRFVAERQITDDGDWEWTRVVIGEPVS